jgi:hypothetical protein
MNQQDIKIISAILQNLKTFYVKVPFFLRIAQVLILGMLSYSFIFWIQLILILDVFILVIIAPLKSFRWLIFYYQDSIYQINQYRYKQQGIEPPTPPTNANTTIFGINQKNYFNRAGDKIQNKTQNKIENKTIILNQTPLPVITKTTKGSSDNNTTIQIHLDANTQDLKLRENYTIRELKNNMQCLESQYEKTGDPKHSDRALFFRKFLKHAQKAVIQDNKQPINPDFFDSNKK